MDYGIKTVPADHCCWWNWIVLLFKMNTGVTFFFFLSLVFCEAKLKLLRWNLLPGFQNFSVRKAWRWRASTCRCGSTRTHFMHKISPNLVWSHSVTVATAPTWGIFPKTSKQSRGDTLSCVKCQIAAFESVCVSQTSNFYSFPFRLLFIIQLRT